MSSFETCFSTISHISDQESEVLFFTRENYSNVKDVEKVLFAENEVDQVRAMLELNPSPLETPSIEPVFRVLFNRAEFNF